MPDLETSRADVTARLAARQADLEAAKGRERVAVTVGIVVLVAAVGLITMSADGVIGLHWLAALALSTLGLVIAVAWRERRTIARRRLSHAVAFHEAALSRIDDRWDLGLDDGSRYIDGDHPYAVDLDLFGPHSVFSRVNTTVTTLGRDALADTLQGRCKHSPTERQAAVRALVDAEDLREALHIELQEFLKKIGDGPAARETLDEQTRSLKGWGHEPPPPPDPKWHTIRDLAFAGLFFGVLGLILWQDLPWTLLGVAWFINYLILGGAKDVEEDLERFETVRTTLDGWARILRCIEDQLPSTSTPLKAVHDALELTDGRASAFIEELDRKVERLAWRGNMFWALSFDVALLWDLHARRALHAWKRRHGHEIDGWLDAAAAVESLVGLANYAAGVPDQCWPTFASDGAILTTEDLAHPLISRSVRVGNDLTLPSLGGVLLFTGSNMSGKSTFLRSVGLAAVFARIGLPIPARSLRLHDLDVTTCMRIHDDLAQGSSLFHAEVKRLAACVEAARSERPTLVLLDEILAGTNSRERHIGTDAVLRGLADTSAVTLVATHDLALRSLVDQLGDRGSLLHFRDDVTDGVMSFDYRLREGPCPSTNALRVMRAAGLDVPDEG